ncbi:MAG: methylmalonyl-CoA mutase [Planctomycetota bacterium]|nr:MAG: methylmalonyl-CoA mutase [Planctomycetota bacterium]
MRPIRVLISKCGLDGHDRGARVVARSLRDAGFEVVYLGIRQTPETVVRAAIEEDVDAIGISIHSAAHMTLFPRILELLRQQGAGHVLVIGGGIIPKADIARLKAAGVGEIFGPGASMQDYIEYLREEVGRRRRAAAGSAAGED